MREKKQIIGLFVGLSWGISNAWGTAQDRWIHTGPDIAPPPGASWLGPVATDGATLYVGLDGGAIAVLDGSSGALMDTLARSGNNNGMVVDDAGNLRVLDFSIPAVLTIDASSGFELERFGVAGSGVGELVQQNTPFRMLLGIDGSGLIYVGDPEDGQVKVFASAGSAVREWGGRGALSGQFSTGPLALAVRDDGTSYVAGGRFYRFNSDGSVLNEVNSNPGNVVLTPDGLALTGNDLWEVELGGSANVVFTVGSNGACFTKDGTAWVISGGALQRYRRAYAGTDEPAAGTAVRAVPQPRVVSARQREGTTLLDVVFEILDGDSAMVEVRLLAWKDGGERLADLVIPQTLVEGTAANLGVGIATNTEHMVTWDVGADFAQPFGYFEMEVMARDDQPLLPVHWISIPANAMAGTGAFEISKAPVSDASLLGLLKWEMAAGGSGDWRLANGSEIWYDGGAAAKQYWPIPYWKDSEALFGLLGLLTPTRTQARVARELDYGVDLVGAHSLVSERMGEVPDPDPADFAPGDMVEVVGGPTGDFWIGRYEVTYGEWTAVRDWGLVNGYADLPGGYNWGSDVHPVGGVNWYDVVKWCNAKSEMEGLEPVYYEDEFRTEVYRVGQVDLLDAHVDSSANGYRLPLQNEWEYAARGGALRAEYTFAGGEDNELLGWSYGNAASQAQSVGAKRSNSLFIFDLSGNVTEWLWTPDGIRRISVGGAVNSFNISITESAPHNTRQDAPAFGFRLVRNSVG